MKQLFITNFLLIAILFPFTINAQTDIKPTWEPQVAGRFYPATESVLKDQINIFFKNVPKQTINGKPIAVISPHAGYQYSGQVAAFVYNAIKNCGFNRVIVLAFPHRSPKPYRGVSILNVREFKTPLGNIPVDHEACNQLLNSSSEIIQNTQQKVINLFGTYEGAYQGEHSLETQLPFLQMSLVDFKLVPVMVGVLIDDDFDQVANAIKPLMNDKTIVVVSSDFTHYGEGFGYVPFKKDIENNIKALDYGAFNKIINKDFEGFKKYKMQTGITACGVHPIELLLKLLPEDAHGEILNYDTSGRQTNDFSHSVSYASIIFTKPSKSGHYVPEPGTQDTPYVSLTEDEKIQLLSLASNTLETFIKTGTPPKFDITTNKISPKLYEKYGVFVTLKKHGELRGCIGHILPKTSLFQSVIENTINSSSNDWRFNPVNATETPDITIEISVLSQLQKINSPGEFTVGKEGIVIRKDNNGAVFLPQVATEQGWSRAETLCHLCRKAGLPADAWQDDGMEFYIFTANVFHEKEKL